MIMIVFSLPKNPKIRMEKLSEKSTQWSQITGMELAASFCTFTEQVISSTGLSLRYSETESLKIRERSHLIIQ